ncbi:hypothetical protein [Streptomyces sp. RK75]|uniref:hypothetical protein n=1 Tax=Streptomyces sp. RK75 TaxID=2824895 RepID=UPI001B35A2CA|nr:hypothetical protein [Streptomyces sp. RK75]MBQ0867393.1 hypothetical protein [Streptomyces sp. RK75]
MTDDLIRRARAAQHHAARALHLHGLTAHTRRLLHGAGRMADAALEAGYPVTALHQPTYREDSTHEPRS